MPVAGAAIGAAGSILGGKMSGDGAKGAAQTQAAGVDAANKLQWATLQQVRADNQVQNLAGQNALARMMEEMGFGVVPTGASPGTSGSIIDVSGRMVSMPGAKNSLEGFGKFTKKTDPMTWAFGTGASDPMGLFAKNEDISYWEPGAVQNTAMYSFAPKGNANKLFSGFQADPSYQFRLKEGENALNRSLAARGGLLSGAAVKAGQRYAGDMASNEYGNYWNRLATLAGFGPQATSTTSSASQNTSNSMSNNILAGANARASGYAAQGQANANMVNSLANIAGGMNFGSKPASTGSSYPAGMTSSQPSNIAAYGKGW